LANLFYTLISPAGGCHQKIHRDTNNMLKVFYSMLLIVFFFVTALNPYVSSKGAALASSQNSDQVDLNYQPLEEEVHQPTTFEVVLVVLFIDYHYPEHISLEPQHHPEFSLKPPSFHS
jgi:hypothetical protein